MVIDSGVKLVVVGVFVVVGVILDDDVVRERVKKFVKDVGNCWVEYFERNVIVVLVCVFVYEVVVGDKKEVERVLKKVGKFVE